MKTFSEKELRDAMYKCFMDAEQAAECSGELSRHTIRQYGAALELAKILDDTDAYNVISESYKKAWKR